MVASSTVQFGSWIPLGAFLNPQPGADVPPSAAGLFQLRVEQGLLRYPQGKSAMVAYGAGDDVGAALREFLDSPAGQRAQGFGPLLVRFAGVDAHSTPTVHLTRLHQSFHAQFGSLPLAEVAAEEKAVPTEK